MNLSNFPERLNELLFEAQITRSELNEKLGCGSGTVNNYLNGRFVPSVEMVIRMADFFQCTTDFLLGVDDENRAKTFRNCPPFGERLLQICEYYKISRYKLQKLTGISESVMRYWVNGKYQASIESVILIADKLHCTIDFVLGREI